MTVIAYRDGALAADSFMISGGGVIGSCMKIARNKKGDLAGAAGTAAYSFSFLKWFSNGERGKPPQAIRDNQYMDRGAVFRRSGVIEIWEPEGRFELTAPYYSLGSGKSEALGAMWMGATAEQAVEAAMALDQDCGGEIRVLRHDG